MRTFPVSATAAGAERTGRLGLMEPMRTLPVSAMVAGAERTGRLGLMEPIRTLPVSMIEGAGTFTVVD
jgi:hypothetical protein